MRMRPHHLLCTQGYEGRGYSEDFIANMTAVTDCLRKDGGVAVDLVFSTDDICEKCPNMLGEDLCKNNSWVKKADRKVADYFELEEKRYIYADVLRQIDSRMTETMFADICSACSWYPVSACKMKILNK